LGEGLNRGCRAGIGIGGAFTAVKVFDGLIAWLDVLGRS
jgi:hypothetical protein